MGHTECFAKSYQLDYCVLLHLHVTQHSVAWHHHVLLELGFSLLRLYHRCSCVAVLLLLLILTSLTQAAAGCKTSSMSDVYWMILAHVAAQMVKAIMSFGGVAAC